VDKRNLAVLTAELNAQMGLIDSIYLKVEARSIDLLPEDEVRLESLAYQLHNLYSAIEDLLKIVAAYFENQIADTAQWHSALLRRMTQPVETIRPAFLSQESFLRLNSLRGFRHFFRHAYGVSIDYIQLRSNLDKALELQSYLRSDLDRFLDTLSDSAN
jgi:hypothetical protein